jgi:SAM-dependent methyltransferase
MDWYGTAFGAHYAWLYAHRDDDEAAACVDLLETLCALRAGPVLDLGCGAGRHLNHLARRGAAGCGLDLSPSLLDEASRGAGVAGGAFTLLRGDMRALPLADGACATVLSLFTAFGYFGALLDHAGQLAEIARVLRRGGRWCLDYLNPLGVRAALAQGPVGETRTVGPCRVVEEKRLVDGGARVEKRVVIHPLAGRTVEAGDAGVPSTGLDYVESVALFTAAELDALAAGAGLRRVEARGGYDGRPFDEPTAARWILVYAREKAEERS